MPGCLGFIWWYMKWLFVPSLMILFLSITMPDTLAVSDTLLTLYGCMTLIIPISWWLLVAGWSSRKNGGERRVWVRGHWRRIGKKS
jgi:hypothetical protein